MCQKLCAERNYRPKAPGGHEDALPAPPECRHTMIMLDVGMISRDGEIFHYYSSLMLRRPVGLGFRLRAFSLAALSRHATYNTVTS